MRTRGRPLTSGTQGPSALADAVWFSRCVRWLRAAVAEFGLAVFPADCAGCGRPGQAWCPTCDAALAAALMHPGVVDDLSQLDVLAPDERAPVIAAGRYGGVVASAILAAKTKHGRRLLQRMVPAMNRLVAKLPQSVHLVPVPPASGSVARRGFVPVEELLAGVRPRIRPDRWLAARRRLLRGPSQKGRDRRHRGSAVRGSFRLRGRPPRGHSVVLIDDVMTTGATLAECARVLRAAGLRVRGALVLAHVPDPHADPTRPSCTDSSPEVGTAGSEGLR